MNHLDLWLVRHAESIGNLDGTAADSALSAEGRRQAIALRSALPSTSVREALTSPLLRARETAALAAPHLTPRPVRELRELESARSPTFIDPDDAQALAQLLAGPVDAPDGGKAFMTRVSGWLQSLPSDGTILAFTHFAVIREILSRLLGFRSAPQCMEFTAIFRLSLHSSRCEVLLWNDTQHLRQPP